MPIEENYKKQHNGAKKLSNTRLEFEAVFFINIDKLAMKTQQFTKYMYVGATRAATYFGITTTSSDLPNEIKYLETDFRKDFVSSE